MRSIRQSNIRIIERPFASVVNLNHTNESTVDTDIEISFRFRRATENQGIVKCDLIACDACVFRNRSHSRCIRSSLVNSQRVSDR